MAIETQGFSFVTSGRKRESLTVSATVQKQRGTIYCKIGVYLMQEQMEMWISNRVPHLARLTPHCKPHGQ